MSGHPELLMSLVEQFYIQLAGEAFIVKVRDHSMLTGTDIERSNAPADFSM